MAKIILPAFWLIFLLTPSASGQTALRDSITECWMKSAMSLHEEGFRLDSQSGKIALVWAPTGNANRSHLDVPVSKNTIAVFHTHSGESNYRPSSEDARSAATYRITVYVISAHAVWNVTPEGKIGKFADR